MKYFLQYLKNQKIGPNRRARGDPLRFFIHSVIKKIERGPFEVIKNFEKKSHDAEKFGIFQHPYRRKTSKKLRGDPLGNFCFEEKVSQCPKIKLGDPLVSPGIVRRQLISSDNSYQATTHIRRQLI